MSKRVKEIDYETRKIYGGHEKIAAKRGRKLFVKVNGTFMAYDRRYMAIYDMNKGCKACCLYGDCARYKKYFGSCMRSERPDHTAVIFYEIKK